MTVRRIVQLAACLGCFAFTTATAADDREMVSEIFRSALADGHSYRLLGELCERHPHRLSGSPGSNAANLWAKLRAIDESLLRRALFTARRPL